MTRDVTSSRCTDDLSSNDDATLMPDLSSLTITEPHTASGNLPPDFVTNQHDHSILSTVPENSEQCFLEPSQAEILSCQNGFLMETHDVPVSSLGSSDTDLVPCTLTSDPHQSEPRSLSTSTPSQADDWSQKLYTELDAIFQIRENRYNSRMGRPLKVDLRKLLL